MKEMTAKERVMAFFTHKPMDKFPSAEGLHVLFDAEAYAETLNKIEGLKIAAKASESGNIFGSVNTIQMADAIKAQFDIDVDRKKISIVGDAIKEIGTHKIIVSVYKEIKSEITFEVYAE